MKLEAAKDEEAELYVWEGSTNLMKTTGHLTSLSLCTTSHHEGVTFITVRSQNASLTAVAVLVC